MKLDPLVRILVNEARQRRLTYSQFNKIAHQARRKLGLKPPHGARHLTHILPHNALTQFYEVIDKAENPQHSLLLRLLFYTAVRVSELCRIEVAHVDLGQSKIFIDQGKGSKDRYVLYPDWFGLALRTHLAAHPQNRYLFESNRCTHYSTRMVEHIGQKYASAAGLGVHPHWLRRQNAHVLNGRGNAHGRADPIDFRPCVEEEPGAVSAYRLERCRRRLSEALRKLKV